MLFSKRKILLTHETIQYYWNNVSEVKYNNYIRMKSAYNDFDTKDFSAQGFPWMLQIEPTNMCNLSCPLCPSGMKNELGRNRRHMSMKEFVSIIDDMSQYLLFIVLWDWGEPFMNPELPEMIKYASDQDIKVLTSTNAHFLHKEKYVERILKSGLSTLIIAIDSLSEENYLTYRKGGDLAKAISGLENLMKLKRRLRSKTRINLRMVIMKSNEKEVPKMMEFARKLKVDKFTIKTVNPSCGLNSMDSDSIPENPKYRRYVYKPGTYERITQNANCTKVWNMSNILSNGDVVPCCYDYNAEMKCGNIHEEPFTKIWNGPRYKELRERIYIRKDDFPKCKFCTINFRLSEGGWFPEAHNFNMGVKEYISKYMQRIDGFALRRNR